MHDYTKGGMDVADLLSTSHSARIKCKRWPLNVFAFILDTCGSNTNTILQDNRNKMSNFEFTYSIGEALALHAVRRSEGLQIRKVCR